MDMDNSDLEVTLAETESIIRFLNQSKAKDVGDVWDGYLIEEVQVSFKDVVAIEDFLQIRLPSDVVQMPEEIKKKIYLAEEKPQNVFMGKDRDMFVVFNKLDIILADERISEFTREVKNIVWKLNPAYVFYDEETLKLEDYVVSYFDFKSYSLEGDIYNFMYYVPTTKGVLHGAMNMPIDNMKHWKKIFREIIMNLKFL